MRRSRFDGLGWLQFQRLCSLVLDVEDGWRGDADGLREVMLPAGLTVGSRALPGPVRVRCAWLRPGNTERERRGRVQLLTNEAAGGSARWLVIAANVPRFEGKRLMRHCRPGGQWELLGDEDLIAAVAARPAIRLRLPSVLGVEGVAPAHEWTPLARRFVPTAAYSRAVDVLSRHHFLVLTGPPEMGKTAIARMIGLARLSDGWEVHECTRPEEVLARLAGGTRQLFIADDAFGSTEYRPDAAERWARALERIVRATDARHELVWTSRPAPLRAGLERLHRERGAERFPQPAEVQVDAAALTVAEKAQILLRHASAAGLERPHRLLVRAHGPAIVAHPAFTPERIRRFVADRLPALEPAAPIAELAAAVEAEIAEPTRAMAASFAALASEHRELLVAMLDSPPGPVAERDLAAALRRHASNGLHHAPADLIDRLTDHFVKVLP